MNGRGLGYVLGANNFSDWADEEIRLFHRAAYDDTLVAAQPPHNEPKVSLPAIKDWRADGKVTASKQQGGCGACWAFAATAVYECLLAIESGRLVDLSEEFVLECANRTRSDCTGGYVTDAYDLMSRSGVATEAKFPYQAIKDSETPNTAGICSADNLTRLGGTTTYKIFRNLSDEGLRALVAAGPVAALIFADSDFVSYRSGIYRCSKSAAQSDLNHAVAVVGYDASRFILKNSYGTTWGQEGFMDIAPDSDCGLKIFVYQLLHDRAAVKGSPWLLGSLLAAALMCL